MANPRKGWTYVEDQEDNGKEVSGRIVENDFSEQDKEWLGAVTEESRRDVEQITEHQIVNFKMLWAVVDFVFS